MGITTMLERPRADRARSGGAGPSGHDGRWERFREGRTKYLVGAVLIALCVIMVMPVVASVLASIKPSAQAAAIPPTYLPSDLSPESYQRLWEFQAGLPTYLANSLGVALLTIAMALALTVPAGYALGRFPIPGKEFFFIFLLLALIIPYQALLTPIFVMFTDLGLTNTHLGLAIIHTAIQLPFSLYIMRNSFEGIPKELEEAAAVDGANSWQVLVRVYLPSLVPAVVTVTLFAFIMSWNEFLGALVMMNKDSSFTLPVILVLSRTQTSLGGTDWGLLQAGVMVAIIPCVGVYLLLQKYYVAGLLTGAIK